MTINNMVEPVAAEPLLRERKEPTPLPKAGPTGQKAVETETNERGHEQLKAVLAESDISLNFRTDESSGRLVVEMIDNSTGEPVRQIPNEVSLRLGEMFSKVQGQLFEVRI